MPLSYAAGLLRTYISGAASYLMILWWACLTLVLRMVILRTTRGQDRKRRFGSFCSWISTMVWRTAALSDEGGNRRLVQDLAADDVDRAHVGVPVGVGAEFVGRFGDEHLCRVVGDQQSHRIGRAARYSLLREPFSARPSSEPHGPVFRVCGSAVTYAAMAT